MSKSMVESAPYGLKLVADSFTIYPLPDTESPEPGMWGQFLVEHPAYIDGRHRALALHFASERSHTEGLGPHYQRLAGALIGIMYSQHELLEMN